MLHSRPTSMLFALWFVLPVAAQMTTAPGTTITIAEGTNLRIDPALTWEIASGADVVNNGTIILGPATELSEAAGAAIIGGGTERTTRVFSGPLAGTDPGGLGALITTSATLGTTTIERGHIPFTDYSGHTSISRWIDLSPSNNNGLQATLAFRYDVAELNGVPEAAQQLHIRSANDIWLHQPGNVNLGDRTVTATDLDSLGVFTTFEEILPNAIAERATHGWQATTGSDGAFLLYVPEGSLTRYLALMDAGGRLCAQWKERHAHGWHRLPNDGLPTGVYHLLVNDNVHLKVVKP